MLATKPDSALISSTIQQLSRMLEENPFGPPEVDPLKEAKINDLDFVEDYSRKKKALALLNKSKCQTCPKLGEQVQLQFLSSVAKENSPQSF